jgi:molybdate transport system substrate-binding protein
MKRIKQLGERPDVFMSPGETEMKLLVEAGIVDPATVTDFGTLDIVLITGRKIDSLKTLEDLKSPNIKTISLADPATNSIGYYASEALKKLGLWEPIQSKLLLREAPLEAVTLATDGKVDAGITFMTCPLETAPEKADASNARIVQTIPRETYPPVRLQLGILKDSKNREAAQRYLDFLTSEEGQKAIAINGIKPASEIK